MLNKGKSMKRLSTIALAVMLTSSLSFAEGMKCGAGKCGSGKCGGN